MSVVGSALNLAKIAAWLALETPIRPRWAYYRARGYAYHYLLNRRHQQRTSEYASRIRPIHEAVAYVTGCPESDVCAVDDSALLESMVVEKRWVVSLGAYGGEVKCSDGPIEMRYGPSPELMHLVNLVVRLLKPDHVLETGVAKGFTTASVLDALDRNEHGHLHSVELPSLYIGYSDQVGERIPDHLRSRWTLELGPSALAMPRVLARTGGLEVFIHDSAANYDNQRTEFRIALDKMPAGGVLVSDMLNSDAFLETTESIDCRWAVVKQTKEFPLGILCKLS